MPLTLLYNLCVYTCIQCILVSYTSSQCLVEGTVGLNLVPLPTIEHPTTVAVLIVVLLLQLNLHEEC